MGFLFMYAVNIMMDCILQEPLENPNPLAKAELNLLAHLVGGATKKPESELLIGFSRVPVCASSALISWRQLGRVDRALDLKSGDSECKSRSHHQLDLLQVVSSSTTRLICLLLGFLTCSVRVLCSLCGFLFLFVK